MLILDTHVLIWLISGDRELGRYARRVIERAWLAGEVGVSAITFWEVAMLRAKGRTQYPEDVRRWRRELFEEGLVEIPVDGEIGIRANELLGLHDDPTDRIIVATAQYGHRLVTADHNILAWGGDLYRLDARV